MTLSPLAKHVIETEMGWAAPQKPRRSTPEVSVDLGNGTRLGGPLQVHRAIAEMREVWGRMEEIAREIQRLDDLIDRQQQWLSARETDEQWLVNYGAQRENIERRNVLWRDELPDLERRATRIVERMDGPERSQLAEIHPHAAWGGMGLMMRFSELAPLINPHPDAWPSINDCPF